MKIEVRDESGAVVKRPGARVSVKFNREPEAIGFKEGDRVYVDGDLLYTHGLPMISQWANPGVARIAVDKGIDLSMSTE